MKILVTADLHYDIPRSRLPACQLIRRICDEGGDVLVLVGDTAGAQLDRLAEVMDLLAGFDGLKLIVPGNHCLWCRQGEDSIQRYENILPALVEEHNFRLLDHDPVRIGSVGLVGSVGWYDYSFADESLGIPEAFYQAKIAPGAARMIPAHSGLLDRFAGRIPDRALAIHSRWMDGVRVRLPVSDKEFCRILAAKLAGQLRDLSARTDRIIAFLHHLPFVELVPPDRPDQIAFAAAYLGAPIFGRTLLACEKVTDVYCAHSHWPGRVKAGRINVVNIGSTYCSKRLEVLDV